MGGELCLSIIYIYRKYMKTAHLPTDCTTDSIHPTRGLDLDNMCEVYRQMAVFISGPGAAIPTPKERRRRRFGATPSPRHLIHSIYLTEYSSSIYVFIHRFVRHVHPGTSFSFIQWYVIFDIYIYSSTQNILNTRAFHGVVGR